MSTGALPAQSLLHGGRYLILTCVGQGGMGAVYRALDLQLSKRMVAVKEMSQDGLSGQELRQAIDAFTREAELLIRLKHQSLPHIYEQFQEGGRHYLVMEFIEGETLEQRINALERQGTRFSPGQVLQIARQLGLALDYLHSQQPPIIFRDLKPANIILDPQERVYLIDFGIARLFKAGQGKDTMALGSPGYAPPEQYRQATSPRSDIYSLGVTLHQMLTGDDPSLNPFLFKPFSVNIPSLEQLVQRMVALDEHRRPPTMRHVLKNLDRIVREQRTPKPVVSKSPTTRNKPDLLTLYAVGASDVADQRMWDLIHKQLCTLIADFPEVHIMEQFLSPMDQPDGNIHKAAMVLLLLSEEFLAMPAGLALTQQMVTRRGVHKERLSGILLRPCNLQSNGLAQINVIPEEAITHISIYAQEQRIVEVTKYIRRQLVRLLLAGKRSGAMSLQQWLLWQLHGDGQTIAPYYITGSYVLRHYRSSGLGSVLLLVFDRQRERMLGEYVIESLHSKDLERLLQVIAATAKAGEVWGNASQNRPAGLSSRV